MSAMKNVENVVMSDHAQYRRACIIGVKAMQNVRAAAAGLHRIRTMYGPRDPVVISSLFQAAIIRYGRPFTETRIDGSKARYPLKRIKQAEGFSVSMHDHLLNIRDTLIAHDDFDQITPRVLVFGLTATDGLFVPLSVGLSNKCLGFPAEVPTIVAMHNHCAAAELAMSVCLKEDAEQLRMAYLRGPDPDPPKYANNYGQADVGPSIAQLQPPEFMNDAWLDPKEPDFSDVHAGFRYEMLKWRHDLSGPGEFDLGNGATMRIVPTNMVLKGQD